MTELVDAPNISTVGGIVDSTLLAVTTSAGAVLYQGTALELKTYMGGGGGGGGGSLVLLATVVAAGTETALDISGIDQTYDDLVVVFSGNCNGGSSPNIDLTFNGDTGGDYTYYRNYGGHASGSDQQTNATKVAVCNPSSVAVNANDVVDFEFHLPNYKNTVLWKGFLGDAHSPNGTSPDDGYVIDFAGKWKSTAAINQVTATLEASTFSAGSVFTVYGRGGSGGAGAGGYQLIGRTTAAGGEAALSVGSIPSTFKHLRIFTHLQSNSDSTFLTTALTFNGDTGANYDWTQNVVTNSNSRMSNQSNIPWAAGYKPAEGANFWADSELDILFYSNDQWKCYMGNSVQPANDTPSDEFLVQTGGKWRGTAAINEVTISATAAAFQAGSIIEVWGL